MFAAQFMMQQVIQNPPRDGEAGGSAPENTELPAIRGTATSGETLTSSTGTWTGEPTSYAYQWLADAVEIGGATASTFELTDTQIGAVITCTVTATNAVGSTAATSAGTDAVAAAAADPVTPTMVDFYLVSQNSAGSTITLTNRTLGDYDPDRKLYMALSWRHFSSFITLNSLTIGGAAMSRITRAHPNTATRNAEIWSMDAVAGTDLESLTTATVEAIFSTNSICFEFVLYQSIGAAIAASDTDSGGTGSVSDFSVTLDIPANGFALVMARDTTVTAGASLSNVTEDKNHGTTTGFQIRAVHGHKNSVAGEELTSVYTSGGTGTGVQMAAASFAPA